MRHQAFQEEGLILRLQGTLPGAVAMVLPMIGNRGGDPFACPAARREETRHCLRGFLSLPLLITSPGLHIGNAGSDSKGHIMALSSISITVNGEAKEVEATTTGVELFADDKDIIAVRLNGELRDLCTPLSDGDEVEPVAIDSEDGLGIMRHSATHVMAQAVQELFPNVKLGVGRSSRTASTTTSRSTNPSPRTT